MASLTDILTAAKNVAANVNTLAQTYLEVQGLQNTAAISASTLVKATPGRLVNVVVTTAGSAGAIYDSSSTSTVRQVYVIPATLGVVTVNLPMNYGILVVPGTSQVVTVSWS